MPNFEVPISPDELAGLSCEEEVYSRIYFSNEKITVKEGPFSESIFSELPEKNWTLLVQEVDHWSPQVAQFREYFKFLPSWRMDDVTISYATDGGTVGAHLDLYDVFITQVEGKRIWKLENKARSREESTGDNLEDNPDVKLLNNFKAEQEYILEPGDILYIPPGYAHYGVSIGESLSFSMGFRAPSVRDMLSTYFDQILSQIPEDELFQDPKRTQASHPTELRMFSKENLPQWPGGLGFPDESFLIPFGEFLTRPLRGFWLDEEIEIKELPEEFTLIRNGSTRICHTNLDKTYVFVGGKSFTLSNKEAVETFLQSLEVSSDQLQKYLSDNEFKQFLLELIKTHAYTLES